MKFIKSLLFLLLWQAVLAVAAPIKVEVDRKSVNLNESFQITFSTTEEPNVEPDFKELEKDFEILDQKQSKNSSWINGVSSSSMQWQLDVMAKHTGNVTIPAVHFGSEISPELNVTVNDPQQAGSNDNPHVVSNNAEMFLEVAVDNSKPYVQSQVLYTLKFYRRVNIAEASLKDPEIADAIVTKLDNDKNYQKEFNGVEYVVTERHYAIFPQKSGVLTIPRLVLTAMIWDAHDSSGFGDFFGMRTTRRARVFSKEIQLEVLPVLPEFKGQWLVANDLELKQEWSGDVLQMKVGEPLTRTLTLTAQRATVGQLPKLQQAINNDDLKSYPDQPKLDEQKTPQGIIALREEKIAFIASKAGTYALPAVEIPWFNVQTQKMELAKLPVVTVVVTGEGKVAEPPKVVPPVNKSVEKFVNKQEVIPSQPLRTIQPLAGNVYLWQSLTVFFGVAWLATLALFFRSNRKMPPPETTPHPENSVNPIKSVLKQACMTNDANAAKQTLIIWGKQHYDVMSLGALAEFCDARLRNEVLLLNEYLYSQQTQAWEGKRLFQAFCEHNVMAKNQLKRTQKEKLEPLHRI